MLLGFKKIGVLNNVGKKFGKLEFERLFITAELYAREGFPLHEIEAYYWKQNEEKLKKNIISKNEFLINFKAPNFATKFKNIKFSKPSFGKKTASPKISGGGMNNIKSKFENDKKIYGYFDNKKLEKIFDLIYHESRRLFRYPPLFQFFLKVGFLTNLFDLPKLDHLPGQ